MTRCGLAIALACFGLALPCGTVANEREAEIAALAEQAEAGSTDAIAQLIPLIHDPDAKVRHQAEWGLARAGAPAVPALIDELRRRGDDESRARVARMLGHVGPFAIAAIPELRGAMADADSSTAGAAAYALGHARAREAVPDLVATYVASRTIPNQREIARALRTMGSDQGIRAARSDLPASVEKNLASGDPAVRDAAVTYTWALYRAVLDDGKDEFPTREQLLPLIPGLIAALDSPDLKIAEQAVKALALAGRDAAAAVPALERLIGHPSLHHVAMATLRSLGSREAERVVAERLALEQLEKRIRSDFSVRDHQGGTELLPFRVAGEARDGLQMSARFLYPGREPSTPTHVIVHLESTSMQPRFADAHEILWIADDIPIRMQNLDRTRSESQIGGVIEHVSALLPTESFLALANARTLSGRAGGVEFTLRKEDRAALHHFATKIPPPR